MKRREISVWVAATIAVVAAGASAFLAYRLSGRHSLIADDTSIEEENDRLKQLVADRERKLTELQGELGTLRGERTEGASVRERELAKATTSRLDLVHLLAETQTQLDATKKSLAAAELKMNQLQATVDQLQQDNGRLSAELNDVKDSLASNKRIVDALQAEVKTKTGRITQLTLDSQNSRSETRANAARLQQYREAFQQLEEIERRRDACLTSLTRRYKDLNSEMRALTLKIDSGRDTYRLGVPDLSRIQDIIQSADDDLQQLTSLDAHADRLRQQFRRP